MGERGSKRHLKPGPKSRGGYKARFWSGIWCSQNFEFYRRTLVSKRRTYTQNPMTFSKKLFPGFTENLRTFVCVRNWTLFNYFNYIDFKSLTIVFMFNDIGLQTYIIPEDKQNRCIDIVTYANLTYMQRPVAEH
jgi:hypothetical protein